MAIHIQAGDNIIAAVAEARKSGDRNITFGAGDHFLDEPIVLGAEDAGLNISGEEGARLFGGKRISGWQQKSENLWSAKVPEVKDGSWDFRMLIVNDRYASRARYPEEGFLIHETDFDVTWLSTYEGGFERKPTYEELTTLKYKDGDLSERFEPANAELTIFHMWDESLVGIKGIDRETRTLTFSNPSGWPPGAFAKAYNFEKRYIVWNTIEGMTQPGQWFLDRANGEVVYWPLPDEDMNEMEVIAPMVENLLIVGDDQGAVTTDITIANLSLSGTNAPLMSGAFGAKLFDGAISLRNVQNVTLENLSLYNVGAHCIKASGDDIKISSCHLHHAGAGAIRLVGSRGVVYNNHIHHIGRTFPSAIALYVGATDPNVPEEWEPGQAYTDCEIQHNELHDVPYAAICAGGKNLKITKNLIYRAMQDLYDGAGIYITFCNNALVKHNFIKDIKDSPGAGTSAYYLDEKAIDCLVEENMEINVPRPSHNHISKNNTFRNNFFIIEGKGWFSMERSEGYTFEKNVVVAGAGFELFDLAAVSTLKNNILFSGKGKLITKELNKYEVVKTYEIELKDGNINQDPKLASYRDGKVVFAKGSPAEQLGIKAIDVSGAGLVKEELVIN